MSASKPQILSSFGDFPICFVRLKWSTPWLAPPAPHLLRGAIASLFPDNDLFHQHSSEGDIFRYPRVHYRWDGEDGIVVGIGDGVHALGDLLMKDLVLRLGNRLVDVTECFVETGMHKVTLSSRLKRYRFRSPWLPLNQENYRRFENMGRQEKLTELDRIAVANLLSAMKGLNIRISECVYAAFIPQKDIWCPYKNQKLRGFLGTLVTNVNLPDDFAIGKAVSHGYGWLKVESSIDNEAL